MASIRILRPLLRPQSLGIGLGLSTYSLTSFYLARQKPSRFDGLASPGLLYGQGRLVKEGGGLDPKVVRQISTGSVCGILTGLAISTFSRSLTFLIGILVIGLHYLSTALPYIPSPNQKISNYIISKTAGLRTSLQKDPALKVSFGMTFAMAAFLRFQ